MQKLFSGTRGDIYLIDYFGKRAVLKKLRPGKPNTLAKEAAILKTLDQFAPKLYDAGYDYIVMEYIEGISLKEAIKKDFKKAILLALRACYYLDKKGIYHKELGRWHHFIYDHKISGVKVIDFERATIRPNPRNLLQFVGFYLRDFDLRQQIELYKRDRKKGFEAIIKALDV